MTFHGIFERRDGKYQVIEFEGPSIPENEDIPFIVKNTNESGFDVLDLPTIMYDGEIVYSDGSYYDEL